MRRRVQFSKNVTTAPSRAWVATQSTRNNSRIAYRAKEFSRHGVLAFAARPRRPMLHYERGAAASWGELWFLAKTNGILHLQRSRLTRREMGSLLPAQERERERSWRQTYGVTCRVFQKAPQAQCMMDVEVRAIKKPGRAALFRADPARRVRQRFFGGRCKKGGTGTLVELLAVVWEMLNKT